MKHSVNKIFAKIRGKVKKHSPEILIASGVIGVVVSAVMACRATTKVSGIVDKTKDDIQKIHQCADDENIDEYTSEDAKKDMTIVYAQTGVRLIKLYAPSVILGTFSIISILASNDILRKRNIAIAAAYSAVDKGFKEYRKRVVERFGDTIDKELRYNIQTEKATSFKTDEEGNKAAFTEDVKIGRPDVFSDYARFFDESCEAWEKDSEYNLYFLRARQSYANDLLKSRGYLFLNEVYDMLGIPKTKAGQIVGWVYDTENPLGDNYVDFGIYDINRENARDFVNGYERCIILDFNVDGNILDRI